MESLSRIEALLASLEPTPAEWERQTVIHWTSVIGRKDPYYVGHVANVCALAQMLGTALDLPDTDTQMLVKGALIHDIGKIDVPEPILGKPGRLTDSERSRLQNYCSVGQAMVQSLPSFRDVVFLARSHHEKLDGSGYPDGLKGETIPLLARILTAADVFDAIRSERVYKSSVCEEQALAMLLDEVNRNWLDATVVEALRKLVTEQTGPLMEIVPARAERLSGGLQYPLVDKSAENSVDVLVVEDNDDISKMIGAVVGTMGLPVHMAANGREALELFRREPNIGIVLLDLVMPQMDGFEFCHALREDTTLRERMKTAHIIILSARCGLEDKVKGLQLGAADYLTKPFDPRELRARVAVGERLVQQQRVLEAQRSLLEEMVRVDSLTGVCSRGFFEQLLREEWNRASRYHHPVSVIMADVDHFKRVNDRYGHGYGDRVLARIGSVLRDDLREPDIVARYGGEEFVVLLPETGADRALLVAERLRQKVKAETFQHPKGDFHVTISCGTATVRDSRESSLATLLDDADKAMYRSKMAGA